MFQAGAIFSIPSSIKKDLVTAEARKFQERFSEAVLCALCGSAFQSIHGSLRICKWDFKTQRRKGRTDMGLLAWMAQA